MIRCLFFLLLWNTLQEAGTAQVVQHIHPLRPGLGKQLLNLLQGTILNEHKGLIEQWTDAKFTHLSFRQKKQYEQEQGEGNSSKDEESS